MKLPTVEIYIKSFLRCRLEVEEANRSSSLLEEKNLSVWHTNAPLTWECCTALQIMPVSFFCRLGVQHNITDQLLNNNKKISKKSYEFKTSCLTRQKFKLSRILHRGIHLYRNTVSDLKFWTLFCVLSTIGYHRSKWCNSYFTIMIIPHLYHTDTTWSFPYKVHTVERIFTLCGLSPKYKNQTTPNFLLDNCATQDMCCFSNFPCSHFQHPIV